MKKTSFAVVTILLSILLVSCGKASSPDSSRVTVRSAGRLHAAVADTSYSSADVKRVRVTVTGAGMDEMAASADYGSSGFEIKMDVPNGNQRHFRVAGLDAGGITIYLGTTVADLSGEPVTLSVDMYHVDLLAPTVLSTNPARDANDVAVNSAISVTFSEAMDEATLHGETFKIAGVEGTVTYAGTTATFRPSANLEYSTTYTATITTGAKDSTGNALEADYIWSFTTGVAPDTTPPSVTETSPASDASDVAVNSVITAKFSETMDASTLTDSTFHVDVTALPLSSPRSGARVARSAGTVAGMVTYEGTTATFTPSANLEYSTTYTVTVTTGAKDSAGNALANDYSWTFATAAAPVLPAAKWGKVYGTDLWDGLGDIKPTAEGGYIATGTTYALHGSAYSLDVLVMKLDADGNIVWQKTYGGNSSDYARSIVQTADGNGTVDGYIIAGSTSSFGAANDDAWLIRLDKDGNVLWQKSFGGSGNDEIWQVRQTADGGFIAAGTAFRNGSLVSDAWVLKLCADGFLQWEYTYGGELDDGAYSIIETAGGYVVAGYTKSPGKIVNDYSAPYLWLVGLNSSGELSWNYIYGGPGYEAAISLSPTGDGGFIVAGETTSFGGGDKDVWIIKYDGSGNRAWEKRYGDSAHDEFPQSIAQTSDGGFIVAATVSLFDSIAASDLWVFKINSNGDVVWQKTYNNTGYDLAFSVTQSPDGGFIVAATTGTAINSDVWVLKLGENGEAGLTCDSAQTVIDAIDTKDVQNAIHQGTFAATRFSMGLSSGTNTSADQVGIQGLLTEQGYCQ